MSISILRVSLELSLREGEQELVDVDLPAPVTLPIFTRVTGVFSRSSISLCPKRLGDRYDALVHGRPVGSALNDR